MTKIKRYRFKTDNKMNCLGDADLETKEIRINKKRNKKRGRGELVDTIKHEINHLEHPRMREKNIKKLTKRQLAKMSQKEKNKLYHKIS